VDAGRRDGGFFATFPCRWSLGLALEIARRPAPYRAVTGAVHPTLDQAVVFGEPAEGGTRDGALIGIAATPTLRSPLDGDAAWGRALTTVDGYAMTLGAGCLAQAFDRAFEPGETATWGAADSRCFLVQSRPGQLTSIERELSAAPARVSLVQGLSRLDAPTQRSLASLDGALTEAFAFTSEEAGTTLLAYRIGPDAWVERHGVRVDRYRYPGEVLSISAASDRLRGGMLVLHEERTAGWFLDWIPEDADPPQRLIALEALPARPAGPLVSNETEALIPLANGQMAYVPLALSELRLLEAVDGGEVSSMRIVLRPGSSGGGLLFTQPTRGGESLRFQSLICNR